MKLKDIKSKESIYFFIVFIISFCFAIFSTFVDLIDIIYDYLKVYVSLPIAEFIRNFIFLYLVGLLWYTFRFWKVSEKKRKELEDIVSSISPDVLMVIDLKGKIVMCNTSIKRMFDYEVDEVYNQKTDFLYHDVSSQEKYSSGIHAMLEKEGFNIGFATGKKKNGDTIPLEIITGRLSGHGGAVLLLRDITEREMAENAIIRTRNFYLSLLDEFPALVWRSGVDTKRGYFNKTWLNFTGRTLEQEREDGWAEVIHPDDIELVMNTYLIAFDARKPFENLFRMRRFDGKYCWFVEYGMPYNDIDGNFAGYIGSCLDITDYILRGQ